MDKFKKAIREIFEATSTRDKILLGVYLLIFMPLGLMMRFGVIPFPETVTDWFGDIINSTGKYAVYIGIFIAMQIANVTTLVGCAAAEDGFVRLIKRQSNGYYNEDKLLEMAMSFSTALVSVSLNLLMFPMFVPVYIVIGVVWVLMSAK